MHPPVFQETLLGHREEKSLKPQNPQGIKALSVGASGSSWQVGMRTGRVQRGDGGGGGGGDNCPEQGKRYY